MRKQIVTTRMQQQSNNKAVVDPRTGRKRTSSLKAPTMLLEVHKDKVYTCQFSLDGKFLATAGHDKDIQIWEAQGECKNTLAMQGHKNAVMQVSWSKDSDTLFSCSADHTSAQWDVASGTRVRQFKEHGSFVNAICPSFYGMQLLATASDDGTAKIFDLRMRKSLKTFDCQYQCTAVCFDKVTTELFTSGIDCMIKCWDIRKPATRPKYLMSGHGDTITDLKLSPQGTHILSNSMDSSLRLWDIRPYCKGSRSKQCYLGIQHNIEMNLIRSNFSPDGRMICSGSANGQVYIFDRVSRNILYILPGHKGSVNEVDFHPLQPIVLSCGSDKKVYVGEL